MALVTGSIFIDILLALLLIVYLVYWYFTNNDDFWDKRGIPNTKRGFFFISLLGKQTTAERIREMYNSFSGEKFAGAFQFKQPVLMVRDLELINRILVKDFSFFPNQGHFALDDDPLAQSLNMLKGQEWRTLRYKLTPTFSSGKLKGMFDQLSKCGDNMIANMEKVSKENNEMDSKEFLLDFTLDVISSCAFGFQFSENNPEGLEFKSVVKKMFKPSASIILRVVLVYLTPKFAKSLTRSMFPMAIANYFINLVKYNMEYRKTNNITRNDYFQLLLTLKEQEESGKDMGLTLKDLTEDDAVINQMQYSGQQNQPINSRKKLFTDEVICSNSFIFLTAGSESVASTISLSLFQLSQHPDIQHRLQEEIDLVLDRHGRTWSYEAVKDMTYLDQVIQETQRLYPVFPFLLRECVENYKIPDSDVVIEKGVRIMIPVPALHRDPQYYPEPDLFKPERFEGNNFKPNPAFLPFGDGPRICIAMRFAVMEVKTCVARIMSQYSVKLGSKTQFPLKFDPRSFTPTVKGGLWLSFEKRSL